MTDNGNGVRITNREIYDLLLAVRDEIRTEVAERKNLATQVRAQWFILGTLVVALMGGAVTILSGQ